MILLHPATKKQLKSLTKLSPQAILLHGRVGTGLGTVASELALQLTSKANIVRIVPDEKGTIKIITIRELYKHTRTKQNEKLVVLIDDADTMQEPAQNALLKLLEEPPAHVVFILTAHSPQVFLPTILSRVQKVEIAAISNKQTNELLDNMEVLDQKKRLQLQYMANGLPAELTRLVQSKEHFEKRSVSIKDAREFIQGSVYEKLIASYRIGNDREKALELLQDIARIVEISLKQKPSSSLAELLSSVMSVQEKLLADGNIRTQLLKLAVN